MLNGSCAEMSSPTQGCWCARTIGPFWPSALIRRRPGEVVTRVNNPSVRPRADVPDGAQGVRRGWDRYTAGVAGLNDPGQNPEAYPHIHSVLARRIRGGEYPAGAKLPTEAELADEFGCGPDAAAMALRALQRDGLARKVLRRGYVSSGPDAHPG
jgi:Bacterial regulatory proteins, gntR family